MGLGSGAGGQGSRLLRLLPICKGGRRRGCKAGSDGNWLVLSSCLFSAAAPAALSKLGKAGEVQTPPGTARRPTYPPTLFERGRRRRRAGRGASDSSTQAGLHGTRERAEGRAVALGSGAGQGAGPGLGTGRAAQERGGQRAGQGQCPGWLRAHLQECATSSGRAAGECIQKRQGGTGRTKGPPGRICSRL